MFKMLASLVVDDDFVEDFVKEIDVYESFGIEPCLDWETLGDWYGSGDFSSVDRFRQLVDDSYISHSNWGLLTTNNRVGKALYARALYHLYRKYEEALESGSDESVSNEDLVIPKYVDEGKLYSYGVNTYTLYAFERIENKVDDGYLDEFAVQLDHVDQKLANSYLKYEKHRDLWKYLKSKLQLRYLSNEVRVIGDGIGDVKLTGIVKGRNLTSEIVSLLDGVSLGGRMVGFEVVGYRLEDKRVVQLIEVRVGS